MTTSMSEEQIYEQAKKRVEVKKGFFIHLTVYVCVNALLIIIWVLTGAPLVTPARIPWFIFPLGGWGIGLLFNFLGVFVFSREGSLEKRAIEKEAEKIKREQR